MGGGQDCDRGAQANQEWDQFDREERSGADKEEYKEDDHQDCVSDKDAERNNLIREIIIDKDDNSCHGNENQDNPWQAELQQRLGKWTSVPGVILNFQFLYLLPGVQLTFCRIC